MTVCKICGSQLDETERFCNQCGQDQSDTQSNNSDGSIGSDPDLDMVYRDVSSPASPKSSNIDGQYSRYQTGSAPPKLEEQEDTSHLSAVKKGMWLIIAALVFLGYTVLIGEGQSMQRTGLLSLYYVGAIIIYTLYRGISSYSNTSRLVYLFLSVIAIIFIFTGSTLDSVSIAFLGLAVLNIYTLGFHKPTIQQFAHHG